MQPLTTGQLRQLRPQRRLTNYLTKKMEPQYEGEETGAVWGTKVQYLSAEERKAYELKVGPDGLLRDAKQQLFDTSNAYTADGPGKAKPCL